MGRVRTKTGGLPYSRYHLQDGSLEMALDGDYTTEDRQAALGFFKGCAFCGAPQAPRNDHLVPVIQCGDFVRRNVVPACQKCDDSKGQKKYREWMRSADSPSSLKRRGMTEAEIERRIRRIETWQAGYKAKTEEQLFGKNYKGILQDMDALCLRAKEMVNNIKAGNRVITATHLRTPVPTEHGGRKADEIRQYVVDNYVTPARSRGEKRFTVRSGEVHARMQLTAQLRNVCQALKGTKLQQMAGIALISVDGPTAGANTFYKYRLL